MKDKSVWKALLSLSATPLILFISSSTSLYLQNQGDLSNNIRVLYPFWGLFSLTYITGIVLLFIFRSRRFRFPLLIYYLTGPIFISIGIIKSLPLSMFIKASVLISLCIILIGLLLFFGKRIKLSYCIDMFSIVSIVLIVGQIFLFVTETQLSESAASTSQSMNVSNSSNGISKPNIYQIILDEFQADMFLTTLSPNVKAKLGGFTFFPETTTIYGRTGMSLPSIFTGVSYDYTTPQINYMWDAFNTEKSILFWLKKEGYHTAAYIHPIYDFELELFDEVYEHKENVLTKSPANDTALFINLWFYSNLPNFIAKLFLRDEDFNQLQNQNMLSDSAPVLSRDSFQNILRNEHKLEDKNRYTFVHLLIPHFPYVLSADGTYVKEGTTPLEQAQYATKVITDFVDLLKKLGRFDDSLIIIQSDHGARFELINNSLKNIEKKGTFSEDWSTARSRSLLLIKPAGTPGSENFQVLNRQATLLDIAPTIQDSVKLETGLYFEGTSLLAEETSKLEKERYYHFFDKKGRNEWTDELTRYIIKDSKAVLDKKIPLNNNSQNRFYLSKELNNNSFSFEETQNIKLHIDKMESKEEREQKYIMVQGWAFIEGQDSDENRINIVLSSEENQYVFDTNAQMRRDVTKHFKELNLNLDNSGYISNIPTDGIQKGVYNVGIYISKGDITGFQYTDQYITK